MAADLGVRLSMDEENHSEEENRAPQDVPLVEDIIMGEDHHDSDSEGGGLVIATPLDSPAPPSVESEGLSEGHSPVSIKQDNLSDEDRKKRFLCRFCGKGFSLMNVLKVHERIHTGERPYICNICNKAFNQSGSLNRHKQTHARRSLNNRYYSCRYCSKQFIHSSQLQAHEATHSEQLPAKQQQEKAAAALNAAVAAVTAAVVQCHACDMCTKRFASEEDLKTHKQEHFQMAQFALSAAGMLQGLFPDTSQLLLNQNQAKNLAAAQFAANLQLQAQQNPLALLTSSASNTKQNMTSFASTQVPRAAATATVVSSPSATVRPTVTVQANVPKNGGDTAAVVQAALSVALQQQQQQLLTASIQKAIVPQQPQPQPPQPLQQQKQPTMPAAITTRTPAVAKVTSKSPVPVVLPNSYKCSMCAQRCPDAASLHLHMRLHETSEGKKCIECGKQFTCASALKIHFRTHSGERPYACAYCGKSFSQNGTLKRHHQTCKNARNWHLTAGSGRSASSSRQKREDGSGLDLSMNTSGMDVDEEDEPLDKELEEEELREAEEADAAMEAAEMAQIQNFLTPEISAQGTAVLTGEDFVDGVLPQAQESDDGSDSAANSANAGKPGAGKSSIDAICATLAEKRCYNPIQSASVLEESLSPGTQVFMSQMESRTVGQSTLTGLIDYLLLKGKLYRCEHCQIFFLDSALYFLHRSQHAANSPYTCSVCGHVAQEKYGFHSHFIEQHSKSTPVKKA